MRNRPVRSPLAVALILWAGAACADSFTLENVSLEFSGGTYSAARLEFVDSATTRDETLALLAGGGAPSARIAKISAARIASPEIVATSMAPASQKIVYRDVALESVKTGRVARWTAAGATFTVSGAQGAPVSGQTGAIAMEDVDLAAIAHSVAEARADDAEALRPTVGRAKVDAIDVDLPGDVKARIGSVALRGLGARALAVPMASLVDAAPKPDAPPPSPERRRALAVAFVDLMRSQSMDAFDLTDLSVRGGGASPVTVSARSVAMADVKAGRFGRFAFEGLLVEASSGRTALDRFSIAGLDVGPVLEWATRPEPQTDMAPLRVDSVSLNGLSASIPRAAGAPLALQVARAAMDAANWGEAAPQSLSIAIDNVAFDLPKDDVNARPLIDLGYGRLDTSFAAKADYDAAAQELTVSKFALASKDVGSADLTLRLIGVRPDVLSRDRDRQRGALAAALMRHATATVSDSGLLARLVDAQARRGATSAADLRARWATLARANVLAAFAGNAGREALADAVARFVQNGGQLTIEADEPNGVGLIDATLAGGLPGLLGRLKLTATQR